MDNLLAFILVLSFLGVMTCGIIAIVGAHRIAKRVDAEGIYPGVGEEAVRVDTFYRATFVFGVIYWITFIVDLIL